MNALHGSSSSEMATRELAFFFPDFVAPSVEAKGKLQRTLALVRPEAFKLHKGEIYIFYYFFFLRIYFVDIYN